MIELHGWLTIRETYKAICDEEETVNSKIEYIQEEINKLLWFKPEIKAQNGDWYIEFSLYANRITLQITEVFELVKKIGIIAEGSYGLLYLYNDEDTKGKNNEFQVFTLARGVMKESRDCFLSPVIPIIEDRDNPD